MHVSHTYFFQHEATHNYSLCYYVVTPLWHIQHYFSGLRKGDLLNEDDPDVVEAIRRLPPEEFNLRQFRVKRALDLSMKHQILPKEQWTPKEEVKFHNDFSGFRVYQITRPFVGFVRWQLVTSLLLYPASRALLDLACNLIISCVNPNKTNY